MGEVSGRPSKKLSDLYVRLAKGGVGAIITGSVGVSQNGKLSPQTVMIHSDELVDDLRALVQPVKDLGTPLIVQILHAGGQTNRRVTGTELVGPSRNRYPFYFSKTRELTEAEIWQTIKAFVDAIHRAKRAGFDCVQLHAAHGYLLSAFLSPKVNKRKDKWGKTTENRVRIISEIVQASRQRVGAYPILVKFSGYDGDKGGITLKEGVKIAKLLEKAGVDAVEVSCGGTADGFNTLRVPKVPVDAMLDFVPKLRESPAIMKVAYKLLIPFLMKRWEPLYNYNVQAA
jgi:2,4-dienoyl-CoA reductase-like NADH-dependent reductase (Old Yellow Enzyme family)